MPNLASFEKCTGCEACYNACSHQAIAMQPVDAIGHLYPVIDNASCVECKLCEKSCPVIEPIPLRQAACAYAAWSKDEDDNKASTSGAAASCLSEYVLEQGGIVYGCANEGCEIRHLRIDKVEDVDLLRGSKYVRSEIGLLYRQVKDDLRNEKTVLFVGTPCQVAGLKAYIRNSKYNERLITADLICHGTPSHQFLMKHIRTIVNPNEIRSIIFREQGAYLLRLVNNSGAIIYDKNYWKKRYSDDYMFAFMNGYSYRESCYTCPYAIPERTSDLTLGDFWGLGKDIPFKSEYKNYGISVILPNTDKGKSLVGKLGDRLHLVERPIDEAVRGNDQLRMPKRKSITASLFRWAYLNGISIHKSLLMSDFMFMPIFWMREKLKGTR